MTTAPTAQPRTSRFGPLTVRYDHRVLEPRPWTLLQSQWAADLAPTVPDGPILELCAGAGHIGQAAALLSGRSLVQVELDPVAAGYATDNATGAGLADRVEVRQCSLDVALAEQEFFPLVVADPPYLPTVQITRWPDDPLLAIDGGSDGLDLVRRCLRVAADHMQPGAVLLLQTAGDAQTAEVVALTAGSPERVFDVVGTRRHDAERAVVALRRL